MEDRELYRRILGVESPWSVTSVDLQLTPKEVHIYLAHDDLPTWPCAECAAPSKLYDHQPERVPDEFALQSHAPLLNAGRPAAVAVDMYAGALRMLIRLPSGLRVRHALRYQQIRSQPIVASGAQA